MLIGNADPEVLGRNAPTLESFATEAHSFENVETLHFFCEIGTEGMESLLPPSLHPTLPPAATWMIQRLPESPWGAFQLAQCRIECRSGMRPRGFLRLAVIDNPRARTELEARWGFSTVDGSIELRRSYDRVEARVSRNDRQILDLGLSDPRPLRPADIYYVASMHLANTPRGLRLIQVDPEHAIERAERGVPFLRRFDAAEWRSDGVRLSYPVSASFCIATVTLPALRYVCRPDILAFQGTESVG